MSNVALALLWGIVFGVFIMGVISEYTGPYAKIHLKDLKAQCEVSLPRSQNCVIQFVPNTENQK